MSPIRHLPTDVPLRAAPAVERRARPRRWRLELAEISAGDAAPISCTIVDISEGGARVRVSRPVALPAAFRLVDSRERTVYEATLVWSASNEFGIKFLSRRPMEPRAR